jgi:hypothetical protein
MIAMADRNKRILLKGKDKYSKITHKEKIQLLKKVICDHQEIKEVIYEICKTA